MLRVKLGVRRGGLRVDAGPAVARRGVRGGGSPRPAPPPPAPALPGGAAPAAGCAVRGARVSSAGAGEPGRVGGDRPWAGRGGGGSRPGWPSGVAPGRWSLSVPCGRRGATRSGGDLKAPVPVGVKGGDRSWYPKAPLLGRGAVPGQEKTWHPGRVEPRPLCVLAAVRLRGAPGSVSFAPMLGNGERVRLVLNKGWICSL